MSELFSRERLQPSLLDRLTDRVPETRRETLDSQTLSLEQLRQAVLRDLAWLLNTTNLTASEDLSNAPLAAKSTINYGIVGFAGQAEKSTRSTSLEKAIVQAIRDFEPRIKPDTLKVTARPSTTTAATSALVFEIAGELWAQPVPQQLFLETSIELETRLAVVKDAQASS